jgi:single-stranded-DNA-specific exonuclease
VLASEIGGQQNQGYPRLNLAEEKSLPDSAAPERRFRIESRSSVQVDDTLLRTVSSECGISVKLARILSGRGLTTKDAISAYLAPTLKDHLPDPGTIKNIVRAAELILESVCARKQITIYSDFDVDGLSSGSQLFLFLRALGANVKTYTPSRFTEGYGLVCSAVKKLKHRGTELLVTVDCGITSHEEIALATSLGIKTIVLDHHKPNGLPPAEVIVNPAQEGCPFQEHKLAAAGLVWMLLIVLRRIIKANDFKCPGELPDPKSYLDLAALGTICDMVPLVGVNRLIAYRGVELLQRTERPGLLALKNISGIPANKLTAGHVGFALGPRINAAGRLGDASEIIEMLTTHDSLRAGAIAQSINRLNERRKSVEDEVKNCCLDQLRKDPALLSRGALALFGESFHLGVIGIVAQRLVEQYFRPVAVMGPAEIIQNGKSFKVIKGSIRSVPGFHVADNLTKLADCLLGCGGHAEAGGFSLLPERLSEFQEAFAALADAVLVEDQKLRRRLIDLELTIAEIDYEFVNEIARMAPFGVGNPAPVFASYDVTVESASTIGEGHLKLRVRDRTASATAVAWRMSQEKLLRKGELINIAFQPEINSYRGISSVQLCIQDVWR